MSCAECVLECGIADEGLNLRLLGQNNFAFGAVVFDFHGGAANWAEILQLEDIVKGGKEGGQLSFIGAEEQKVVHKYRNEGVLAAVKWVAGGRDEPD